MSKTSQVKEFLISSGAHLVGFANLDALDEKARHGFSYGISFACRLNPDIIAGLTNGPTRQYYKEYERVNVLLSILGRLAAHYIISHGYKAKYFAPTYANIDDTTWSTPLPHKTIATCGGLGWIGKCALLVTKEYGSAIRINSVYTDMPLKTTTPVTTSQCGTCTNCVTACPAHAPNGNEWTPAVHRDSFYDAFACSAMAKKLCLKNTGIDDTICGICIAACPFTKAYVNKNKGKRQSNE